MLVARGARDGYIERWPVMDREAPQDGPTATGSSSETSTRTSTGIPDVERFRLLFNEGFPYVVRVLRRFGVSERDVDDAAQEVFVSVHRHFTEYDPARPLRPWLLTFAFHAASNYRRLARHRYETLRSDSSGPFASASEVADIAHRHEARDLLLRALDELTLVKRDVFVMHDIEGMEARSIAVLLGIPVNTVYSRLRLAREELERLTRSLSQEAS